MSLIKCAECAKEISDKAIACPHCGNPVKPLTIEQTSKKWKTIRLISWIGLLVGGFVFTVHYEQGGFDDYMTGIGMTIATAGFVGILVSKFGAWWNNR